MEAQDIQQIKKTISEVWDWISIIEDEATLNAAVGLYFNQVLFSGAFGRVAVLDGKVVGVVFASAGNDGPGYRALLEDGTKHAATLLGAREADRENIREYFTKIHQAYEQLISGLEENYDGTLDFLVLAKESQGHGIGKLLWQAAQVYFVEKGARAVYLYSDTECNYNFYEGQGFKRKREMETVFVFEGEPFETKQFLYEYRFD